MVLASSTFDIPVSATPICNNARGGSEGGIGAILPTQSCFALQTYAYFPGTGETVTVENKDVFVEATGTYSQQRPCLTASSPSLARARKHVAAQLSPCHRITCAKSAPQVMGCIMVQKLGQY
ncbi:hypothetical protein AMR44_18895 [Shewanella algae]|nr:hypothetical protein AMR44_18895 [Shewanella algae]